MISNISSVNHKNNFLYIILTILPLISSAQFGADYSSYGFNFVNDSFNNGIEGWQGTEINNPAKVNIYKQSTTLNDYALELKAQNETIQISYDDAGFIDLNPCSFVINLRLNIPQFTGNQDAFIFKLFTGSKLVDIQFQNDGIYYLDANNNTTLITGTPSVNQFLTYTISIDDCGVLGSFMIENDPLNTFTLDLPIDTQSPIIELETSTDGTTEFEIEIDHLFIYSNPIKWWLGSSVPYGGENNYIGTTGDRQHFLDLPNGERIGINENGGGYMTYTQTSPTGTNLYPNPKFGSGGTKTLRNYFQTADYNPVQAGASSTTGGHLVDINVLPNQLEIVPYPLHLYYKSGITENNPLTFPNGEVMPDFDNSTDDHDVYDEFGLDMRHEIISELDFSSTLDNISSTGGISIVQHQAEWEFIRHPCQLLQYHEPSGNTRYDLDGALHSDSDMGEMRHKFEFRMNKDLGYEWILWRENGQWESMQVLTVGDKKTFTSNSPSTIPLENRFMIFSTSNSLTDPNAIAWYYPASNKNINSTVQKSRNNKSEITGEDRRYKVQITADWRKTNWCRVNLYVFNKGLLAPNHGNTSEYESFQMEAHQLFGTPEQIWSEIQGNTLPVDLLSFNINPTSNNQVKIDWSTASEIQNGFFIIERSKDGSNWDFVENVTGQGNINQTTHYSIIDDSPYLGISFYRLKQIDDDGTQTIFPMKAVTIEVLETIINLYPNPTNDILEISWNGIELKTLLLLNSLGQDVTDNISRLVENKTHTKLNLTNLAEGNYYLVINGTVIKQIIKQ